MSEALDEILQNAAAGDQDAWRSLIQTYSGRVFGLLYRQCANGELAQEITQATFVKVVTKLSEYREQGRFEPWLFRIAMNTLRDEMRRKKRHASTVDLNSTPPESIGHSHDQQTPFDQLQQTEEHDQLRQAVKQLPDADQKILYMRYTAELSFAQIAESLDEPLGTVLARGHRALKKLKKIIEDIKQEQA